MWNFTRKGASEAETIANKRGVLSADYSIMAGQRSQVLVITNVQWRHEGEYKCIVTSENSQIQAEANLSSECFLNNLHLYHIIIIVPLSNLAIRGSSSTPARLDTVTLDCNVTANPPANIMWMKRTSERTQTLVNTSRTSITRQLTNTPSGPVSRSTLTIRNVEATDNGEYICEASNGPSSPSVSADFTMCVIGKAMEELCIN